MAFVKNKWLWLGVLLLVGNLVLAQSSETAPTTLRFGGIVNYHLKNQNYLFGGGYLHSTPEETYTGITTEGPLAEFDRATVEFGAHLALKAGQTNPRTFLVLRFNNTFLPRTKRTITEVLDDTLFLFNAEHQIKQMQTYQIGLIDYGKLFSLTFVKRLRLAWIEEPDGVSYGSFDLLMGLQKTFYAAQKPLVALLSFEVQKEFAHDELYAQTLRFFQRSQLRADVQYFVKPNLSVGVFGSWSTLYYKTGVTNTNEGQNFNYRTPYAGLAVHYFIKSKNTPKDFNNPNQPVRWLR